MRRVAATAAVLVGLLASPAAASTARLDYERTVEDYGPHGVKYVTNVYKLTVRGEPGESNEFTHSSDATSVTVRDGRADLKPLDGCEPVDAHEVRCPMTRPGTGNYAAPWLYGGDGDDVMATSGYLFGEEGNDQLLGGYGSDTLDGGPGADVLSGGTSCCDSVSYEDRTNGVRITPDGVADDGEPGEGDNVYGDITTFYGGSGPDWIEAPPANAENFEPSIRGGAGDDHLVGNAQPNLLDGGAGDDVLYGAGGQDHLIGDEGADVMAGGPGPDAVSYERKSAGVEVTIDNAANDGVPQEGDDVRTDVERVDGSNHDDLIVGSAGPDHLEGEGGIDVIRGEAGDDFIWAGHDGGRIEGGSGFDQLWALSRVPITVDARDGEADNIRCQNAGDTFIVDPIDGFTRFGACRLPFDAKVLVRSRRLLIGPRGGGLVRLGLAGDPSRSKGQFSIRVGDGSSYEPAFGSEPVTLRRGRWTTVEFTVPRRVFGGRRRVGVSVWFYGWSPAADGDRHVSRRWEATLIRRPSTG